MTNFKLEILESFRSLMQTEEVQHAKFTINYTLSGSSSCEGYIIKNDQKITDVLPRDIRKLVKEYFKSVKDDPSKLFNKAEFEIQEDGNVSVHFIWEDEQFKKDKRDTAIAFPHWINERIISLIYSHEFPNGPTEKDNDGDPLYVSTWDLGIFTFMMKDEKVKFEIVLYQNHELRKIDLKLPDYFIDALTEHYEITTNGILSNEWRPWNKLVIHSPHNDLPFTKINEHVFYILE